MLWFNSAPIGTMPIKKDLILYKAGITCASLITHKHGIKAVLSGKEVGNGKK
jgi:hypothetical protein